MQLNHLDLKSQNVLLTTTSGISATAKITAFGCRATAQLSDEDIDICLGTPEWMAPELLDGPKNITRHADVYSFAMVLYELLTVRLTNFLMSDREPDCSVRNVAAFCRWTGHITAILAGAPSSRDTSASTLYRSGRVRTTSALRYTPRVPLNGKR